MTDEPKNHTVIVGRGRLIGTLVRLANEAKRSKEPKKLACGSSFRIWLDSLTRGRGTFQGLEYFEDGKLDPLNAELRNKGDNRGTQG